MASRFCRHLCSKSYQTSDEQDVFVPIERESHHHSRERMVTALSSDIVSSLYYNQESSVGRRNLKNFYNLPCVRAFTKILTTISVFLPTFTLK